MRHTGLAGAGLQRAAAPSLLSLRRRVDTAPCSCVACASGSASRLALSSAWDFCAQAASSKTTRERPGTCSGRVCGDQTRDALTPFASALWICRQLDHSSTGRRIGSRTREVARLCDLRGRRRELARSILVLHQLALHTRPRDGWGSLIRIGSSAATSEQLRRPAATPTAAPAALHR